MRPDSPTERDAVAAEAITWLGTPYHRMARVKGAGADCAQLPLAVYEAAGIIPPTDVGTYSSQWFLHQSEERYLGWVQKFAREIPLDDARRGDFLIWRIGRCFAHGGIVIYAKPTTIVHAFLEAGRVTIDRTDQNAFLSGRDVVAYSPWDALT